MWARCLVIGIGCTAIGLGANNYYLPQIVDGGGLRTTIVLVNSGKTSANVTLAATHDDGSGRPLGIVGLGSNTRFGVKLGAGATQMLATDGSGDGSAGAVSVSSDVPLSVSEILSATDSAGTPVSESWAGGQTDQDLAVEYRIPVDTTAGENTGVALYNPGKTAAAVTVKLFDGSGLPAGTATLTLPAQGHATRFTRNDLFAGVGDFRGSMDIAAGVLVAAIGVRQNAAAAGYTLVPAVNSLAHRMRFFLPQVADGAGATATLATTFLLTNLSAKPATVNLALSGDDGSPVVVNIPGVDSNSEFTGTIAPGATVFWQTDGTSPSLVTGAASIRSDQPIAAAAVVTSYDGQGAWLAETGLAPAPVDYQFVAPFDSASNTVGGALFLNTGSQPVTLTVNLQDANGALLASTQVALGGGARVAGMVSDFFPGAAAGSGAITASAGSPLYATVAALTLRQSAAGSPLSCAPAPAIPWTGGGGTPATVTTKLDTTRQASASIPTSGGTLSVTDAKGNKFTLTLPNGALLNRETITMTAITSATGISGPGLVAGVQLEPDGLGLLEPALLKIELASPAPAGTLPIGWRGAAPGVYLNAPLPDPKSFTLMLTHFSGAGAGGFDLTSELIGIANQLDLFQSVLAYWLAQARQDALSGNEEDSAIDGTRIADIFTLGYEQVVEPMMELATASDDEDVMRCAATVALAYERQAMLLGLDEDNDAQDQAILDFMSYIMGRAAQKVAKRCQDHDVTAYFDAIAMLRQAALMGIELNGLDIQIDSCPPVLQLMYTSEISGTIPIGVTGSFDATVTAMVMIPGQLNKTVLTQVVDPSKDLFTSFTLSGSGVEKYPQMTLKVNNVPAGCSVTVSKMTPDTLTVKAGQDPQLSQVQYKFNPSYQPQAVTNNGQQLCSFCPVYKKTPVKVEMWIDPGKPSEAILSTCPGGSMTIPATFWYAGWSTNHATAGDNGFITGWDLVNTPALVAQKTISESNTGPSATLTEKTNLQLKPLGQ